MFILFIFFFQDRPGFILYRVLMPMINEAFFCMMEGVGTPEDIDRGMRLGTNAALGPLKLADAIGGYGRSMDVWGADTVVGLDRTALGLSDAIGKLV